MIRMYNDEFHFLFCSQPKQNKMKQKSTIKKMRSTFNHFESCPCQNHSLRMPRYFRFKSVQVNKAPRTIARKLAVGNSVFSSSAVNGSAKFAEIYRQVKCFPFQPLIQIPSILIWKCPFAKFNNRFMLHACYLLSTHTHTHTCIGDRAFCLHCSCHFHHWMGKK